MRKIISIICVLTIISMFPLETFAVNENTKEELTFVTESGESIHYYLDEFGMPYQIDNGEIVYIALGLPSLEITDEELISELNQGLPRINNTKAVPTNYFDLSNCTNDSDSTNYVVNATGLDNAIFNTSVLKYNTHHKAIVIKSSNHTKGWGGDKHINITYYYYKPSADRWYSITMLDKDCTIIGGYRFQHSPSLYPYGKFGLLAHNTLKSCKITIYTTPRALDAGNPLPSI